MHILFLFETPLPEKFTDQTLSPGELRVIASVPGVTQVTAIGRTGKPFYDIPKKKFEIRNSRFEIIKICLIPFTSSQLAYYLAPLWLFFAGFCFL